MYTYLFGPVPSRRLGISLGVDLVPMKTCTLNCTYCECGRTTHLSLERKEYVPFEAVKEELTHYLSHNPRPDYVTFSGSGEPTLNSRIGDVRLYLPEKWVNDPQRCHRAGVPETERLASSYGPCHDGHGVYADREDPS